MANSWFHRFFRSSSEDSRSPESNAPGEPRRATTLYVVTGEQIRAFSEPSYTTRPEDYSFPYDSEKLLSESPSVLPPDPFDLPIGIEREVGPSVIKAFIKAEDAINFAYCCNMVNVNPSAFVRVGEEWSYKDDQSAFDIDW